MKQSKNNNELIITNKLAKFRQLSSSGIILVVAIILLAIGILSIDTTVFFNVIINYASELCRFKKDNILLNIMGCGVTLTALYFIYKIILPKINEKLLLILMIIISLIMGFFWVNYIEFRPLADQSLVVYCAECLLDKDVKTILEPGEYLNRNPHQLGCVIYIMTAFKIFNTRSPLVLQNLNVIYSAVNLFLLYLICRELFEKDLIRKIAILLMGVFSIYWAFFSTHVYGNIPGLMFGLIALLFTLKYIKNNKIYNLVIIAISITIAYMLKSNYQIFLCAIIIILGLHTIQIKKVIPIFGILGILITMFGFKTIIYTTISNNTRYSLDTGVSMTAYVYMGIAEPKTLSPGWYTADVETIYNQANFDSKASEEISEKMLTDRVIYLLKNPIYTLHYFSTKIRTTWLNPTFQVFWCSTPSTLMDLDPPYRLHISSKPLLMSILTGPIYQIEERFLDIYQIITFIAAGIGLMISFKNSDLKKALLPLTFLGGFIFHIIWETKAIYVIQYFYIMLPFAALGLCTIFDKLSDFIKQNLYENTEIQNSSNETSTAKILPFKRK